MKFDVSLHYETGGREVTREEWIENLKGEIVETGLLAGAKKIATKAFCSEHQRHPEIVNEGGAVSLKCCCEALATQVRTVAGN